jgi:predicted permease
MPGFITELRHAVRRWSTRRGLAVTAMLTLALGIGATTAIFSVVDGVLLRPLPWRDADRLVTIWLVRPHWRNDPVSGAFSNNGVLSWPMVRDLREHSRTLEEVAVGLRPRQAIVDGDVAQATLLSSGFLPMLGVRPYSGRTFTLQEDEAATESVMISYEAWQRRYGGAAGILGRRVTIDDIPMTIVGVLPPRFRFDGEPAEFFIPYGTRPPRERDAGNNAYFVVARLKADVTVTEAAAEIEPMLRGDADPSRLTARVTPLADEQLGPSRPPLFMLLTASALLLLISCANVAGLLLGDAGSRRLEIAVRSTLGADRGRLARQLLAECVVLGAGGSAGGLGAAWVMTPTLVAFAPAKLPRIEDVAVDVRVFVFALVLAAVTIVVFGLWPSLATSAVDPADALRDGRGASRRRGAHRSVVVCQVALAIVLLVGASLLGETVVRLTSQPVGFESENLMVLRVRPVRLGVPGAFGPSVHALLDHIRSIPGVTSAATTSSAPFSGNYGSNTIEVEGRPGEKLTGFRYSVSDRYFETTGIRVLRGREFVASDATRQQRNSPAAATGDTLNGAGVAVVSEELERRYFTGRALGRRLRFGDTWVTIVGVVADTKLRQYVEPPNPGFYLFSRQMVYLGTDQVVIKTAADPVTLAPALRQAAAADGNLLITRLERMGDLMGRTVAGERYRALLSSMFGLAALMLAAIGLYGLLARDVAERQREIGIRMALGADRSRVSRLVAVEGGRLVVLGLVVGIPIAIGAAQLIRTQLFGVEPTQSHVIAAACAVLGGAALVATLVPARRASRVDPMTTLRAN